MASEPNLLSKDEKQSVKTLLKDMVQLKEEDLQIYASTDSSSTTQKESKLISEVELLDSETAAELLGVCGGIIKGEAIGDEENKDEELLQTAIKSIKKVASGTISSIDKEFEFSSDELTIKAVKYEKGKASVSMKTIQSGDIQV